jgi:hypothetical protein
MIACIIPVRYDTNYSNASRTRWQSNELILNSLLIDVGEFGIIIGAISSLTSSIFAGCWNDQRNQYPDLYSESREAF